MSSTCQTQFKRPKLYSKQSALQGLSSNYMSSQVTADQQTIQKGLCHLIKRCSSFNHKTGSKPLNNKLDRNMVRLEKAGDKLKKDIRDLKEDLYL